MHRSHVQRATLIAVLASIVFFQCALADVIYAWGSNDYGQLGLGSLMNPVRSPVVVPFYSNNNIDVANMQITASYHFATSTDGKVFASGNNFFGCLGLSVQNPNGNNSYTPHPTENTQLAGCTVRISRRHANAVCDNKAYGWGEWAGNVLVGTTTGVWPKVHQSTNNLGNVDSVHVVNRATFIRTSGGSYYAAGNGTLGSLGLDSTLSYGKMQKVTFFDSVPIERIFSSQSNHVCAVAANHSLYCWGHNDMGQLGLEVNEEIVPKPTMVPGIEEGEYYISQVHYGEKHTVALSCGGSVLVWGSRQFGVIGDDVKVNGTVGKVQVVESMEDKDIVEIVSGANTIYARSSTGTWYNWGAGFGGLLAGGSDLDSYTPTAAPSLSILGINHIVMGSSSKSAFGWHVDNKFTTTQSCPPLTNECLDATLNDCAADGVAICMDTDRRFKCRCPSGFRGNGIATTVTGGNGCTDIDECAENLNSCDSNSVCVNTIGSYECACNAGYHGNGYTKTAQKYVIGNKTAQGCVADVNECSDSSLNVCSPDAICEDNVWSYNCSCKDGFSGDGIHCTDINECKDLPCGTNSICANTAGNFTCTCKAGYSSETQNGIDCTDRDECLSEFACHPNATCTNTVGSYSCKCAFGFQGDGVNCLPSTSSSGQPTTGSETNGTNSTTTGPSSDSSTTGGESENSTGSSTTGGDSTSGGVSGTGSASTYNMTIGAQDIGWVYGQQQPTTSSGNPDLSLIGAEAGAKDDDMTKTIVLGVFVGFVGLVIIVIAVVVGVVISRRRRQNAWA